MAHRALAVFVTSDNELLRDCLVEHLARDSEFHVVAHIADADRLGEILRRRRPDVLLLDADGVGAQPEDLLAHLRARWPHLKILVLAPHADQLAVARLLRYGA